MTLPALWSRSHTLKHTLQMSGRFHTPVDAHLPSTRFNPTPVTSQPSRPLRSSSHPFPPGCSASRHSSRSSSLPAPSSQPFFTFFFFTPAQSHSISHKLGGFPEWTMPVSVHQEHGLQGQGHSILCGCTCKKKISSTESTQKVRQRKRTTLKRCTLLQDFWTTSKYIFSVFWSGGGGAAGFANTLTRTKWTATQLEFWLAQVYTQNPPPNPLEKYWLIFKNCIQQAWHCAKSSTMSFISWSKAPVLSHTQPLLPREQVFNWLWGFFWNRFWLCGHVWGVRSPSLPDSAVEIARKNQIIWNKFVR